MKTLTLFTLGMLPLLIYAQNNTALENGKTWYEKRAEGATGYVAKAAPIDKAIAYFNDAVKSETSEKEAGIFLMMCYYFKGTFVEQESEKRKAVYDLSKALGAKLIKKYPQSVEAAYWHLVNMAKWGETSGIMKAAREGLADQLKALCEKVISLDPDYRDGAGYRMLGIIHFKTPYIPLVLSWPSDEEAIKNLERSLKGNPDHLLGNLYLAQVLYDEGSEKRALEILQKLSTRQPSKENLVEDRKDIADAQALLKKYKD